ncbi:MAG: hypothetical protein PHG08_03300 [Bacilli bacterium]|jgi:hypothetical protein|nr:hypothetical protein [Bacilli bacterium]HHU24018.1 GerMN domain-containing protein [Acholeplasmataceae bacterium]
MKKKIIILAAIILLVATALLIPSSVYQKWFGKVPIDNNNEDLPYRQIVYVENAKGLLVGLEVPVEAIAEDQIQQKWELLTCCFHKVPNGYQSAIHSSAELIDYSIEGSVLTLNVSEDFLLSDGRKAVETIAWSFGDDEIKEVVLKINDEIIHEVNGYTFNKIRRENGINLTYETLFLYEAFPTTIITHYDGYSIPVTYFHLDSNLCEYIIQRTVFGAGLVTQEGYSYELSKDALVINFATSEVFPENLILTITDSVKANFSVDRLTINGTDTVIHEAVFNPVE